jgi:hypothetical protein
MLGKAEDFRLRSYGLAEEIDQRFFTSLRMTIPLNNALTFQRFNALTGT